MNVSVAFHDETYGDTRGLMVAYLETYGADKLWVVLKPIPIALYDDDDDEPDDSSDDGHGVRWRCRG